ncbi:BON domain-containing protein [Paraburkholderia sp. UYCP14C]|uniref:BON domain-containing protein n=1 Tax=Paraburkholderia sp. UYCP14C TaxID=2511130 RepID=UPI00101F16D0|nr:BON domain-containing protein [Paraburkholderia sp. UYCP14C]RZF26957.1 BON domain-containing protein [Paraburkholderia sp. UYCP14C]
MKTLNLLKALGIALCVATASSAYAQASDAMAAAPAAKAPSTRAADRKLGRDVRHALARAQGFNVSNVFVRARGGAVTLSGSVPESGMIQQAADVTKGVPGVTSVNNKLTLNFPSRGGGGS